MGALNEYFGGSYVIAASWCYVLLLSGMGARYLAQRAARFAPKRLRGLRKRLHPWRYTLCSAGRLFAAGLVTAGQYNRASYLQHRRLELLIGQIEEQARKGWAGGSAYAGQGHVGLHTKEHAAGMPQLLPPHAEAYIRDELGLAGASHPFSHCVRQLKRRGYAEGDIDQDDLGLLLYRDAWAQAKCAALKDELERSGS